MPESSEDYQELGELWNGNRLVVPSYQRRYAWKKEQIDDLIHDLNYVRHEDLRREDEDQEITHYFGTIVLDSQGTADLPDMAGTTWNKYDIVDGQQRILSITILIELLTEIIDALSGELGEERRKMANEVSNSLKKTYLKEYNTRRIYINNDDDWALFKNLVYDQDSPEERRRLEDYSLPSQERLLTAKERFREWLIVEILAEEILDDGEQIVSDYEALKSGESGVIEENHLDVDGPLRVLNHLSEDEIDSFVPKIIGMKEYVSERLLITQYNVESSSEAGRIFQSINDRGRDLMMADRIKSYLVYMADRLNDPELGNDIFDAFSDIADTITRYDDEAEIDEFIRAHWRMWSGETRYRRSGTYEETPNDVHRRIKQLEKHAALSRDEDSRQSWINEYTEDLRKSATAYQQIMHPGEFDASTFGDEYGQHTKRKIEGIHRCSSKQNVRAILMAAYRLYSQSPPILDEAGLYEIVSLLENMAFRVYGAADKKSNVRRDKYRDLSHRLLWAENTNKLKNIFETGGGHDGTRDVSIDEIFEDGDEAVKKTCRAIENAIGNYGYDILLINGLLHDDILEGSRDTDNWNGMKKDAIRHFFWEYEFDCRGETDVEDMPSLQEIAKERRDIEHIWAQNRDEELPEKYQGEHKQYVDAVGNLALLHYSDNRSAKDDSYINKYNDIYDESRMDHLGSLPEPGEDESHPWTSGEIKERRKKLLKFAKDRWETKSYAIIDVRNVDDIGREIREDLIESIRNDFSGYGDEINSGNLPRVELKEDIDVDNLEIHHQCDCGETQIRIVDRDAVDDEKKWDVKCTDCSEKLSTPSYFFHPSNYGIGDDD